MCARVDSSQKKQNGNADGQIRFEIKRKKKLVQTLRMNENL